MKNTEKIFTYVAFLIFVLGIFTLNLTDFNSGLTGAVVGVDLVDSCQEITNCFNETITECQESCNCFNITNSVCNQTCLNETINNELREVCSLDCHDEVVEDCTDCQDLCFNKTVENCTLEEVCVEEINNTVEANQTTEESINDSLSEENLPLLINETIANNITINQTIPDNITFEDELFNQTINDTTALLINDSESNLTINETPNATLTLGITELGIQSALSSYSENPNDWPQFGRQPSQTFYTTSYAPPNISEAPSITYTGIGLYAYEAPSILDGVAYLGEVSSYLHALNATNISQVITKRSISSATVQPTLAGDSVYYGTETVTFYQLNKSNISQTMATYDVPPNNGNAFYGATVADGYVYVSTGNNNYFYQFNATNVSQKIAEYYLPVRCYSSPAVANGYAYVVCNTGKIYQFNSSDVSNLVNSYDIGTGSYSYSSPAVTADYVYVGSYDNKVYQLDADNVSNVIATYTTNDHVCSSPAVAHGFVYIGSFDHTFYQLNASNISQQINNYTGPNGFFYTSSAVNDLYVFAHDTNTVYQLDAFNVSRLLGTVNPGFNLGGTPIIAGGYVYMSGGTSAKLTQYGSGAPGATLNSPGDNYIDQSSSASVNFSCTGGDALGLENISFYITDNNNQNFLLNNSASLTGISGSANWILDLVEGNYTWNCLVYDNEGNSDWATNRTLTIGDFYVPTFLYNSPTPVNNHAQQQRAVEINVTIDEYNLKELTYDWNNNNYTFYNDSLVLMYNFDNVSNLGENATFVVDISKGANNGTVSNGASYYDSGKYGGAYQFDGLDDYINIPSSFGNPNSITISAWFKTIDGGVIFGQHDLNPPAGALNYIPALWVLENGSLRAELWTGTVGAIYSADVADNNWHFATLTADGTNQILYLDGEFVGNRLGTLNQDWWVFSAIGTGYLNREGKSAIWGYFNGSIDEVRIWNKSLSADEVYQQYISNLKKSNSHTWELFLNQSQNSTDLLIDGNYTYSLSANDLKEQSSASVERNIIIDNIAPLFIDLINQSLEWGNPFAYHLNASDAIEVDCFSVNDTVNFQINCSGYLENNTFLDVGLYDLQVTVNDTANNLNTQEVLVNITPDTIPPTFAPFTDQRAEYGENFAYDLNATDNNIFDCFSVNDTINFKINCSGYLENNTFLLIQSYALNITVNDTYGNMNSTLMSINVTDTTAPLVTIITPTNNTFSGDAQLNIFYTVFDLNPISCWYSKNNGITNNTLESCINITSETWEEGNHSVFIYAQDNYANENNALVNFVTDLSPPSFTALTNQSILSVNALAYDLDANDVTSVDCFFVNDTNNFKINCSGYLENNTALSIGTYDLNITVNDTFGFTSSALLQIEVTATPTIGLTIISPRNNINATQNKTFTVSALVSCNDVNCGPINVSLDPYEIDNLGIEKIDDGELKIQGSYTFYDNKSFEYDIYDGCYLNDGMVDVFDTGLQMYINNSAFSGTRTTDLSNLRQSNCAAQTKSSMNVSRKVYVPSDQNWARFLDILNNPTAEEICVDVKIYQNMGSDGSDYLTTSDGDNTWELTDNWMMWDDTSATSGDSAAGFIYQDDNSNEKIDSLTPATASGGFNQWIWEDVCVPAGQTKILMYLFTQWQTRTQSEAEATHILENLDDSLYVSGMSAEEISQVANLNLKTKSGLISMNTSATPFYTTTQNPYSLNLSAGESQIITWTVNATGNLESISEFFVYANLTSDQSVNNESVHWNVTIVNFTVSPIEFIYPLENENYVVDVTAINYTLQEGYNLSRCWYTTDDGVTNSSEVSPGVNFTGLSSDVGANTWTVYCNDSEGILYERDVSFNKVPSISLTQISPTNNINVTQNDTFSFSTRITCNTFNCGEINVSLDPIEEGTVGSGTMGVYDSNYLTLTGTGATSSHFAWTLDQNKDLWTYAWSGGPLYKFNGTTGEYIKTVTLQDNTNYGYCLQLAVDLDGRMYCSAYTHNKITVFWPENGSGITTHALDATENAGGVYFDGKYLWYGQDMISGGNKYSRVDVTDGGWNVINEFNVGFNGDGYGMGVVGDKLFISASTNDYWYYYSDLNFTDNSTSASYSTTSAQGVSNVISFNFNGSYMLRGGYSNAEIRAYQTGVLSCADSTNCILPQGGCVESGSTSDWDEDGTEDTCVSGSWSGGATKSGLVSMNTSATPFYTITQNPYTVNLNAGESETITWTINVTGVMNTTHDFFAFANWTQSMSVNDQTEHLNVTITNSSTQLAPNINILTPSDNTFTTNSEIDLTYLITSATLDSCWYSDNGGTNITLANCANITSLIWDEGNHEVVIYANDTNGAVGSDTVTFTIDTINPVLNIISPTSGTISNDNELNILYTIIDINLNHCWYSLDHGETNNTLFECANITSVTWEQGLNTLIIYTDDLAGNVVSDSLTFTIDSIAPSISITSPNNNTNTTNNNLNVLYSVNDLNLDSCWYSDNGGDNHILDDCKNITSVEWDEGPHTLILYVNDTFGNLNQSLVNFHLDSVIPTLSILSPTNNTHSNNDNLNILYSVNDLNLDSCWYSNNGETNTTLVACSNITSETWEQGINDLRMYVNDSFGNENSENIIFNIDSINPAILITSPDNGTYSGDNNLNVTYSISDDNLDSCWYSDNGGDNQILNNCENFTNVEWSEGFHTVIIYANDTYGNNNQSSRSFTINSYLPTISFISPPEGTISNDNSLNVLYNVIGNDIDSCWYTKDAGATNHSLGSCLNITLEVWDEGNNTVTVYANNTGGFIGSNTLNFEIDLTSPAISIISPANNTHSNNDGLNILYSVSDLNLNSCWYVDNSEITNHTLINCANITSETWEQGTHSVIVYANDSAGNINSSSVNFVVDSVSSELEFISPTSENGTIQSLTNIIINASIIENDLKELHYNWNGTNYTYYDGSLVLMMNFDNYTGINDTSLQNNAVSCTNCPISNSLGKYHEAYEFDGADDYLSVTNANNLNPSYLTIAGWVKGNLFVDDGASLITKGDGNGGEVWSLDFVNGGSGQPNQPRIYFWKSGSPSVCTASTALSTDRWYYITGTYDGNNLKVYVDGQLDNTCLVSRGALSSNTHVVSIGSRQSGSGSYDLNFNGLIDEIRIWNQSLSNEEVYQQYISNLNRYNSTQWYLYVNQSKNATDDLNDGDYHYYLSIKDGFDNQKDTETRDLGIDTISPSINIVSPENNLNTTDEYLNIFYHVSDRHLDNCWYSNDTMSINYTLNNCANITSIIWGVGVHNITIWANDSLNHLNSSSVTFTILPDLDKDGITDSIDPLWYNESNVTTSGIEMLNISVGGNRTNGTFSGEKELRFYDQDHLMINFTHNFSAGVFDLRNVTIIKDENYIIVNLSGQLQDDYNKTLYLDDHNFVSLCAKDAEIGSIDEMSSGCDGANEIDLTSCLSSNTSLVINGTTCYNNNGTLEVGDLRNSALKGVLPVVSSSSSSSSGGGSGSYRGSGSTIPITEENECNSTSDCPLDTTCFYHQCVKLFDVKIIDVDSPIGDDGYLGFTYYLKGMANFSNDVVIDFWLEKDGQKISAGKDTIYLGSFEEKNEKTKIYVPQEMVKGAYDFYVQVSYENYAALSHRIIYVEQNEDVKEIILQEPQVVGPEFDNSLFLVSVIVIILLLIGFLCYYEYHKIKEKLALAQERLKLRKERFILQNQHLKEKYLFLRYLHKPFKLIYGIKKQSLIKVQELKSYAPDENTEFRKMMKGLLKAVLNRNKTSAQQNSSFVQSSSKENPPPFK